MRFYLGTYTEKFYGERSTGSRGIYLCEIDESTEKMSILDSFGESVNPSFIKQTEDGKYLVAVNEKFPPSKLDVYRIDGNRLHLSDSTGLSGIACCYAIPSKDNSFIAAVHYGDGEAFTYELLPNGKIGNKTFSHTNCGSGPVSDRQEGPHAHSIRYIPGVDVYAVCDLGCDRIDFYDYKIGGYCSTAPINGIAAPAGAGPRHIEFSDDGQHIYVSCELSNEVLFYVFKGGQYELKQRISTLPKAYTGKNTAADIHFSPDKKYIYASNRGNESIVEYSVNNDGTLRLESFTNVCGKTPRNFAVTDKYIICANQDSDNVVVLERKNNKLTGRKICEIAIPSPVCIEIIN